MDGTRGKNYTKISCTAESQCWRDKLISFNNSVRYFSFKWMNLTYWKFIYDFVFNSKIKLIFNNEPKLLMTGDIVSTHERRHEEIKCFDVEL